MAETEWVTNLKAEVLSPSKLTLTWSLNGSWDDLEQRVWCRNSGSESGDWDYVYDVHADARSLTWTDCNAGQRYDFCVGARNKGGGWYYGYLYGVPMDAILSAGVADADPASGDVEVEWEKNPSASLGRAELWYRDEVLRNKGAWYDDVPATTSDRYTFEGLPGGRAYDFWVRQRYSEGGYTDRTVGDVWLPGLANLRWEYADDRTAVRLTWEANEYLKGISGEGAAAVSPTEGAWSTVWYEDRAVPGGWVKVDSWIPATQEEYTVSGLQPGRSYRFCVRIRDFGYPIWAEGMRDNDLYTPFVSMPSVAKPKAVSNLRAEYSKADGYVLVTWTNNEANAGSVMQPYDETRIYRQTDGGAWELLSFGSVEDSYSDEVERGHEYRYKVVPQNSAGSAPDVASQTVKVAAEIAPRAPEGVRAALDAATRRVTVSWSLAETWERPVDEVRVYRQADGKGAFEELGAADGSPYVDQAPTGGHTYRYRVQARNVAGWGGAGESNSVAVGPELPDAPADLEVTVDDGRATVTWASAAEDGKPWSTVEVERSDNGGAWHRVASVGGTVASCSEPLADNASYSYRARAVNPAGSSPYTEPSAPAYTRPSAPKRPTAGRSPAGCSVSWEPTARYADCAQVEPAWYDEALYEWVAMPAIDVASGAARATDGAPQTDAAMSYRVRSGVTLSPGDVLWSGWSERSDAVAPSSPPAAPTIVYPTAGAVVPMDETIVLSKSLGSPTAARPAGVGVRWRHNPTDGSSQRQAQVRFSFGGEVRGTCATSSSMEVRYAMSEAGVDLYALADELGTSVYTSDWDLSVRTMGANGEWSPWSSVRFRVARAPRVWFEEPGADAFDGGAAVLSEFPPTVKVGYDGYGYRAAAVGAVEIVAEGEGGAEVGRASFGAPFSGPASAELGTRFWAPEPGAEYVLTATVMAQSGVSGSASVRVRAGFPRPKVSTLRIECDRERGYALLTPHVNAADDGGRPVERMDVWRVVGGAAVLVAEGVADGQQVVDRFAPLNRAYSYRLGAYSDQGVYMVSEHEGLLRCRRAFAYYGPGYAGIARSRWNLSERTSLSRSRQTLVEYAGRPYPVLYDGGGVSEVRTAEFVVDGEDEWRAVRAAAESGGVVYKGADGEVFRATCKAELSVPDGLPGRFRSVVLTVERLDGDAL